MKFAIIDRHGNVIKAYDALEDLKTDLDKRLNLFRRPIRRAIQRRTDAVLKQLAKDVHRL